MLTSSFISFSQVIDIEFDTHMAINCGQHITYEEVIDSKNIKMFQLSKGAGNRYVIDLDKKTATLYSNGVFINENLIIEYLFDKDSICDRVLVQTFTQEMMNTF